jgi:hypothetical protein
MKCLRSLIQPNQRGRLSTVGQHGERQIGISGGDSQGLVEVAETLLRTVQFDHGLADQGKVTDLSRNVPRHEGIQQSAGNEVLRLSAITLDERDNPQLPLRPGLPALVLQGLGNGKHLFPITPRRRRVNLQIDIPLHDQQPHP